MDTILACASTKFNVCWLDAYVVRSKPEHGSAVEGKLLPREVVRPISESGKWIEFEYYHWLHKEHRTGWALKKYFQRVPTNFEKPDSEEARAR